MVRGYEFQIVKESFPTTINNKLAFCTIVDKSGLQWTVRSIPKDYQNRGQCPNVSKSVSWYIANL
jgi:hypothetical protein